MTQIIQHDFQFVLIRKLRAEQLCRRAANVAGRVDLINFGFREHYDPCHSIEQWSSYDHGASRQSGASSKILKLGYHVVGMAIVI